MVLVASAHVILTVISLPWDCGGMNPLKAKTILMLHHCIGHCVATGTWESLCSFIIDMC